MPLSPNLAAGTYAVILAGYQDTELASLSAPTDITLAFPGTIEVATPFGIGPNESWHGFYSADGGMTWNLTTFAGPLPAGLLELTKFNTVLATPPDQGFRYRAPQISLAISRDGGHSFGNPLTRDCGRAGEFQTRVRWLRLGQARDWVFEISCSDPIPWRIIDASIFPDYPSSRLATNLRKQA